MARAILFGSYDNLFIGLFIYLHILLLEECTNMKKIAFIHDVFPIGGAERITLDICNYLYSNSPHYRCYVFATKFDEESLSKRLLGKIETRQIPRKAERSEAVERLIVEEGINLVVLVVRPLADIKGIAERTGCKVLFANHGEPFWQRYSIIKEQKRKLFNRLFWHFGIGRKFIESGKALAMAVEQTREHYNCCDAYTVLCEGYRQAISKTLGLNADDSKIHAIENSERIVDNVTYEKEKIIMYCGRLFNNTKRLDRLIRIWEKVQHRLPDYRLQLVGDGRYARTIKREIAKKKLQRVELLGWQPDVEQFFRKASIVCLTSQTEGWPLSLTEAQAHGCIPVAFGCTDGVKDILSPSGINGFVVVPFDEDEYAETLVKIAGMSDDERLAIRKSAVAKRAKYSPEFILGKWKKLFDDLLK